MNKAKDLETLHQLSLPDEAHHLTIITVAYKSTESLKTLAASIANQSARPTLWLIVDNSPFRDRLKPDHEWISSGNIKTYLLPGKEDTGFAAGCNRGLQWLEDHGWQGWVWLLNPDAILSDRNSISKLIKMQRSLPSNALVGTTVRSIDGRFEKSAGWIEKGLNFRKRTLIPHRISSEDSTSEVVEVDWLSGCSMLLKPGVHSKTPRFDEQFSLYYEDLDFCLRHAASGKPVLWTNVITVDHQRGEGSTTPSQRRLRLSTVGYLRFLQRHRPRWQLHLRSLRLLGMSFLRFPIQPRRSLAVLQGWWEATCHPIR